MSTQTDNADMAFGDHKSHAVKVGDDGINRCECGEEWPDVVGQSHLDALLKEEPKMAETVTYDNVGMLATSRCDRCGGQAYVEALMHKGSLLFCSHHATQYEDKLKRTAVTIVDHRPFLLAQEGRLRDAASAAK